MALTKQQVSLITLATLKAAPGGYLAELANLGSQTAVANLILNANILPAQSDAEFALTVAQNLGVTIAAGSTNSLFTDLAAGMSRADAVVKFANAALASNNATLNTNLKLAVDSNTTSTDLTALKAVVTPAAETVTFNTWNTTGIFQQNQLISNVGKEAIDKGQSKISADYTFVLKNQANVVSSGSDSNNTTLNSTIGNFEGTFLSPILERAAAQSSNSALYVRLLDGFAARDNLQPIERLPTNGFGFNLDGALVQVVSEGIYNAKNYTELRDAIAARLTELATGQNLPAGANAATYAKLATFTVELGNTFTKTNQAGQQVSGTEVIVRDTAGGLLQPVGFSTFSGIHPYTDFNSINELDNQAPTTVTQLISTNINAENVGYGSQGGSLNIAGQSASEKGVEEFKVTATKGVWFTRLESRDVDNNHHLQEVILQSGSQGYFRVGTQKNSKDLLVALADQQFGITGAAPLQNVGGGLVDVLKLDASALAGSVAVNAFVSDKVIARNFNLKDTGVHTADDVQIHYGLTSGNDIIKLALASEVVAYADTKVTINTGAGGDDQVHLKIVGNTLDGAGKIQETSTNTYGNANWLANQQLNNNIKVEAMSGNNTIWTEGSGNVQISTGGGNDTIYTDNSGRMTIGNAAAKSKMESLGYGDKVNSLIVMNAQNNALNDLLSNSTTANAASNTGAAQQVNLFKATVQVKFEGFESKFIQVDSTNYRTSTQQVNQAIKKAINEDPVLNKLLVAIEFPGNVLVVESLIDGVRNTNSLDVSIIAPVAYNATETAVQKGARELTGAQMLGQNDALEATKVWVNPKATTPDAGISATITASTTTMNNIYQTGMQNVREDAGTAAVVATPTQGVAEVLEAQTYDFTSVAPVADGDSITITVDGQAFVFTAAAGNGATPAGIAAAFAALPDVGNYASSAAGNIVTITQTATNGAPVAQGVVTGTATGAAAATIADGAKATTADGVTAVNEVQTIDLSAVTVDGGQTLIFTSAGLTAPITYTNGVVGDAAVSGSALATAVATLINVDANAGATSVGNVVTVTYGGGSAGTNVAEIVVTGTAAGTPSQVLQGQASSAHSDNVINSGAGNDVIVLGTGANSNDTLKFTGYDNGKNTIVNFSTNAADAAARDFLDFREYLQAKVAATGVVETLNATIATGGTLAAGNQVAVINFTLSADPAKQYVENFEGLTASKLLDALNTQTGTAITYAGLTNTTLSAATLAAGAETSHYVVMVHNQANVGEYKAFHLTATAGNATSNFADAKFIGTYDFGALNNGATSVLNGIAATDFVALA